eukprot:TRINITY_DN4342_c0_g1_i1.p1 TRINITY_DN4342_c0_g1~~TRINITY_DN4342_c0_g1_i1.p1  ORF type:complete len:660 (+),score=149.79 TRINITY_DN4342_c0_g1_i1:68-2047(+)
MADVQATQFPSSPESEMTRKIYESKIKAMENSYNTLQDVLKQRITTSSREKAQLEKRLRELEDRLREKEEQLKEVMETNQLQFEENVASMNSLRSEYENALEIERAIREKVEKQNQLYHETSAELLRAEREILSLREILREKDRHHTQENGHHQGSHRHHEVSDRQDFAEDVHSVHGLDEVQRTRGRLAAELNQLREELKQKEQTHQATISDYQQRLSKNMTFVEELKNNYERKIQLMKQEIESLRSSNEETKRERDMLRDLLRKHIEQERTRASDGTSNQSPGRGYVSPRDMNQVPNQLPSATKSDVDRPQQVDNQQPCPSPPTSTSITSDSEESDAEQTSSSAPSRTGPEQSSSLAPQSSIASSITNPTAPAANLQGTNQATYAPIVNLPSSLHPQFFSPAMQAPQQTLQPMHLERQPTYIMPGTPRSHPAQFTQSPMYYPGQIPSFNYQLSLAWQNQQPQYRPTQGLLQNSSSIRQTDRAPQQASTSSTQQVQPPPQIQHQQIQQAHRPQALHEAAQTAPFQHQLIPSNPQSADALVPHHRYASPEPLPPQHQQNRAMQPNSVIQLGPSATLSSIELSLRKTRSYEANKALSGTQSLSRITRPTTTTAAQPIRWSSPPTERYAHTSSVRGTSFAPMQQQQQHQQQHHHASYMLTPR